MPIVFYHQQADERAWDELGDIISDGLYLNHSDTPQHPASEIVEALKVQGLAVEWNGDERFKIVVQSHFSVTS